MTLKYKIFEIIRMVRKPLKNIFLWTLFGASMVVALYFGIWMSPWIESSDVLLSGFSGMFVGYFIVGLGFIWYKILDRKYK